MNYTKLFLERFPEDKDIIEINKIRIKGMLDFAIMHKDNAKIACIKPTAARKIVTLNKLGFITSSSQEGLFKKTKNPIDIFKRGKNKSYLNKNGSPAVLKIYSERVYCSGILRIDLFEQFEKHIKENNPNLEIILFPYVGQSINLTTTYLKYKDHTEKLDFHTNINSINEEINRYEIEDVLKDCGYYNGPPLEYKRIDINKWVNMTIYDKRYRYIAMKKTDGLYISIQRALIYVLTNAIEN